MNNNAIDNINMLQSLEYALSVFLFFLVVTAYFLLLNDQEKIK
ncbi:MAG TPA: hypothetical protein VNV85_07635 [Puia sp.]|jgi:hypothetical protein|nr:hypothetical protein [Puia sp.]